MNWAKCTSLKRELVRIGELRKTPEGLNPSELIDWWQDQAIAAIKKELVAREKLSNIINCNSCWEEVIKGVEKLNRVHLEGNTEPNENERKCIVCSAPVACIISPQDVSSDGTILKGVSGYGSCNDGDIVQAVICDRCAQNAYEDDRLTFLGDAMDGDTSPEDHKELLTWTHDKWKPSSLHETITETANQHGKGIDPNGEVRTLQTALQVCLELMPDHLKQILEDRFKEAL